MKTKIPTTLTLAASLGLAAGAALADGPQAAPNGIEMPKGWENWRVISTSHRSDHESLRAILGNDLAIEAARKGETKPWPKGAILAKVVWKYKTDPNWEAATVPGEFSHVEFMIKDAERYADTQGWGYARWKGADLQAYGEDASFVEECTACHEPVAEQDYVYTHPAFLPKY